MHFAAFVHVNLQLNLFSILKRDGDPPGWAIVNALILQICKTYLFCCKLCLSYCKTSESRKKHADFETLVCIKNARKKDRLNTILDDYTNAYRYNYLLQ